MQRQLAHLAVFATLSFYTAIALADYSPAYSACMDQSGGVTVYMLDCSAAELAQQDARLNHFYQVAKQDLETAQQQKLLAAQRAWITFRDNDCDLLGTLTGGTLDSLNAAGCYLEKTKIRADEIQWLAEMI